MTLAADLRCACGQFGNGAYQLGWCRACWSAAHPDRRGDLPPPEARPKRLAAAPKPAAKPAAVPLPCVHAGDPCRPPAGRERDGRTYLTCDAGMGTPAGVVCRCDCGPKCSRYEAESDAWPKPPGPAPPPAPLAVRRVDPARLAPGPKDARFNASLIRFRGRLLMAYRTGWAGAQIHVSELAEDLTPGRHVTLYGLKHPRANHGREDPRLFIHHDKLHVAYVGVERVARGYWTNQMFARLRDDLAVDDVFAPKHWGGHRGWEKNWAFFDHGGLLYAVYGVKPHRVIQVISDRVVGEHVTQHAARWSGGEMRGGAPPVRVGDVYYHWFHGRIGPWSGGVYTVGVYTFEARPPFRVLACTPEPLMRGDKGWRLPYQQADFPAAVFPCGAVLEGGRWRVSMGVQDHWSDVAEWDAAAVDAALAPV